VILVPKFSESHPLSLWAIPILMIAAFVWLFAWALRESFWRWRTKTTRSSIWGFQDQLYEDSDLFFSKQQGKCLWTYYTYFLYLLCKLELHDSKVCYAHLWYGWLDLLYPSLIPQSHRVVIIGSELLSLAWSGLGLGRVLYHYFMLSPSRFILESCENPRD
jgi:hypothetical protein